MGFNFMVIQMRARNKLILGVGVNDANYEVQVGVRSTGKICPYYVRWIAMLTRCYSKRYQKTRPTYAGCEVCAEWLSFSKFKLWMESQDWRGMHLDKDLIRQNNKIYCPELCAFIDARLNSFTTDSKSTRGDFAIGVFKKKNSSVYVAKCGNPFIGKQEDIGRFSSEKEAHLAWKAKKHEHALKLAELQADPRVAEALRTRYL